MPWFKTQFDKVLMALLFLAMAALALYAQGNKEVASWALQGGSGLLGCLLTLVTARRAATPEVDPTSLTTTTVSKTEAQTVIPPPTA